MDAAGRLPSRAVGLAAVGAIVLLAVLLAAVVDGCDDDSPAERPGERDGRVAPGSVTRIDGPFTRVVVDGAPGHVTVVATDARQVVVTDSGEQVTGRRADDGVLRLRWECGSPDDCPGDTRIELPAALAFELRQRSGSVDLAGLAGDVTVVAANAALTADGLRSGSFNVELTSGSLDVGFATAPGRVEVDLSSAHATMHLPAGDGVRYRVTSSVTAGNLDVGVPQSDDAGRSIDVRITSGSAELLPG